MPTLPPNTPRWYVGILNIIVFAIMIGLGLFAKSIDWRYSAGFLAGGMFTYVSVRLKYGFWPFDD